MLLCLGLGEFGVREYWGYIGFCGESVLFECWCVLESCWDCVVKCGV